jgi:Na+/phosphate symporter
MKRIGVSVPENAHRAFKMQCALNLEDMSDVLERAIYEYIASSEKKMEMEQAFEDWLKELLPA